MRNKHSNRLISYLLLTLLVSTIFACGGGGSGSSDTGSTGGSGIGGPLVGTDSTDSFSPLCEQVTGQNLRNLLEINISDVRWAHNIPILSDQSNDPRDGVDPLIIYTGDAHDFMQPAPNFENQTRIQFDITAPPEIKLLDHLQHVGEDGHVLQIYFAFLEDLSVQVAGFTEENGLEYDGQTSLPNGSTLIASYSDEGEEDVNPFGYFDCIPCNNKIFVAQLCNFTVENEVGQNERVNSQPIFFEIRPGSAN